MLKVFKSTLRLLPVKYYAKLSFLRDRMFRKQIIRQWEKSGKPIPPPRVVKQDIIKKYQESSGYSTLIETGTYLGDMIEAQRKNFKELYSIELSKTLWEKAVRRFSNFNNIKILQGDSSKILKSLIKELDVPVIFWLDAHYSAGLTAKGNKDCPVYEEIDAIFSRKELDHIILLDDAREFIGFNDYPTIEELKNYIKTKDERYELIIEDDIIRVIKS
jgi:hypothetical protein